MPLIFCVGLGGLVLLYIVYLVYFVRVFRKAASSNNSVSVYVKELPDNFILKQATIRSNDFSLLFFFLFKLAFNSFVNSRSLSEKSEKSVKGTKSSEQQQQQQQPATLQYQRQNKHILMSLKQINNDFMKESKTPLKSAAVVGNPTRPFSQLPPFGGSPLPPISTNSFNRIGSSRSHLSQINKTNLSIIDDKNESASEEKSSAGLSELSLGRFPGRSKNDMILNLISVFCL